MKLSGRVNHKHTSLQDRGVLTRQVLGRRPMCNFENVHLPQLLKLQVKLPCILMILQLAVQGYS